MAEKSHLDEGRRPLEGGTGDAFAEPEGHAHMHVPGHAHVHAHVHIAYLQASRPHEACMIVHRFNICAAARGRPHGVPRVQPY